MSNTGDPNFAPYPGRYEVARRKGIPPNEDPVPLDVTGTDDLQQQIHEIGRIVATSPVPDGGVSWDHYDADAGAVSQGNPRSLCQPGTRRPATRGDIRRVKGSLLV